MDDFINTSIPQWHRNMINAETVPIWFPFKSGSIDDYAKGGLTQLWELFT